MLAEQRRKTILQKVIQEGQVQTAELAQGLCVAEETIRRDIRAMSAEGLLCKVHGGATAARHLSVEQSYEQRGKLDAHAKQLIGQYAAALVHDHEVIALDGSGATEWMARSLSGKQELTVVTNSFPVAGIITDKLKHSEIGGQLIFLGGQVFGENLITQGVLCCNMIRTFRFNQTFIGTSALDVQGPMMWHPDEGAIAAALAHQAQHTVLLAESAKSQRSSLYKYMDYDDIQTFITDGEHELDETLREALANAGVETIILTKEGINHE